MAQQIIEDALPRSMSTMKRASARTSAASIRLFSWNKGFGSIFAVKALPNPIILQILKGKRAAVWTAPPLTELMLSEVCGFSGSDIMFSSNQTPVEDMKKPLRAGRIYQPG